MKLGELRDKYLIDDNTGTLNESEDFVIQGKDVGDFEAAITALKSNTHGTTLEKDIALTKLSDQIRRESVLIVPKGIVPQLITALKDAVAEFAPKQSAAFTPKQWTKWTKDRVNWANKLIKILQKG